VAVTVEFVQHHELADAGPVSEPDNLADPILTKPMSVAATMAASLRAHARMVRPAK